MTANPRETPAESRATAAFIRRRLAELRTRMRGEAATAGAIAHLAARTDVLPAEAEAQLVRLSLESGMDVVDVAKTLEGEMGPPPHAPQQDVPRWLLAALQAVHVSAAYLTPVRDPAERVVDFVVAGTNDVATDVTGRGRDYLIGGRVLDLNPGLARSGLFDEYLRVYATGERLRRGPFEYVEVRDGLLWPASITVRAVRVEDGLLVAWDTHDDEERLVAGWERAQRIAELGWAEWNLATGRALWTPQIYEMFGREPEEGPLSLDELPARVVAEDQPLVEEQMRTLLEDREAIETEYRLQQRHGVRHLRLVSEPVLDGHGLPVAIRIMAQDVTGLRRRERALAVAHERADLAKRRAEEEHRVAARLQDVLLPVRRGVIDLPGLRIALRYHPGEEADRLGGDWFKARPLPDGRVLVAVGDAMGHGLAAAGLMATMRSGLAGLAYTGAPADQLATWLNELMYHANPGVTATGTAIIGHFDPACRTLAWADAGHPNPVLVRRGRAGLLEAERGTMLGAFESTEYSLRCTQLEAGDLLLLYTDGIVERRGRDVEEGMRALVKAAAAAEGLVGADPEHGIDYVLRELDAASAEDDVCLLALMVL
ncbi:PP2C family protein-serine/threonine phosphatase [Nonomuraea sp. NPDC050328]|uniref:PP2C family protein-serine/threonine phosphatase n=1 Tax=Nonomuraea sp. NPDC050328 TaxID=3364361 RepID=UPI00379EB51C